MTRIVRQDDSVEVRHVTWVGLGFNMVLAFGKFIGGFLGGSQALIADAIHSVSDFITDIAIIAGAKLWNSPPDAGHPYGHRRYETVISVAIGIVVCAVGLGIGYNGIVALLKGPKGATHPEWIAAIMALLSILIKEWLFHYTRNQGRKIRSQALEANAWHHRSDSFSSIPVLIAVVVEIFFPQLWFLDSLGAVIVACFILYSGYEIAWPGIHQVADGGAPEEVAIRLKSIALDTPQVISIHGFRTRYVGSDLHVDLHIVVPRDMTLFAAHDLSEEVERRILEAGENVVDAMVHVDPYDPKKAGK